MEWTHSGFTAHAPKTLSALSMRNKPAELEGARQKHQEFIVHRQDNRSAKSTTYYRPPSTKKYHYGTEHVQLLLGCRVVNCLGKTQEFMDY